MDRTAQPTPPQVKRPPQFEQRRACPECPFRWDSAIRVSPPHLQEILASLGERHPFPCHTSTRNSSRPLNHSGSRYCVGAMRYALARGEPGVHMLLAVELGLWSPDELSTDEPIFEDEDALLSFHADGVDWT